MWKTSASLVILFAMSAASPLAAATATISTADCARMTEHAPDAGVAYQPGVDVNGSKVASATLGGGFQVKPPTNIKIPIQISPGATSSLYSTSDTTVGTVTYENGRVYYNGKPVQDDEAARIARLCQKQNR